MRRVSTLIEQLPPGAALYRAMDIPQAWAEEAHLLAFIADNTHVNIWQKTRDGSKGRNQPKPLQRPGVKGNESTYAPEAVSMEEFDAWLSGEFDDAGRIEN